jgi:hypothetical protein
MINKSLRYFVCQRLLVLRNYTMLIYFGYVFISNAWGTCQLNRRGHVTLYKPCNNQWMYSDKYSSDIGEKYSSIYFA